MSQLGRISGPLLTNNLVRNGSPLTFRNGPLDPDLLFIGVTNDRIGVNTTAPAFSLHVNGDTNIDGSAIINGISAKVGNVIFNTNGTVSSQVGPIIIEPTGADAYIQYGKVLNTELEIKDNYIKSTTLNTDILLDANAAGKVSFLSDATVANGLQVNGNIGVVGNVRLDGMFYVGDNPLDTVVVAPDFTQSIIPGQDNTYNLGKTDKKWAEVNVQEISSSANLLTTTLLVSYQTSYSGNTITTVQSNEELTITSNSSSIQVESLSINQSTITNLSNTPITITHTGNGHLKINDTNGMVIPVGDTSQRVGSEVGATRWNNQIGYMECFDGTVWQVATGGGIVVTAPIMEELGQIYTLIFG
jgi:hypothetical protein